MSTYEQEGEVSVEQALESLGLTLPETARPLASYVPAVRTGNLVYSSGQLPTVQGQLTCRGKVGADVSEDEARQAAQTACLNALSALKGEIGDLNKIRRIVRLTGYVNSASDFSGQPAVINGASELLKQIFGAAGEHSRVAVGVYQLPLGASVEIDLIVEVAL